MSFFSIELGANKTGTGEPRFGAEVTLKVTFLGQAESEFEEGLAAGEGTCALARGDSVCPGGDGAAAGEDIGELENLLDIVLIGDLLGLFVGDLGMAGCSLMLGW